METKLEKLTKKQKQRQFQLEQVCGKACDTGSKFPQGRSRVEWIIKKIGFPLKPDDVIVMSSNVHEWKGKPRSPVWYQCLMQQRRLPWSFSSVLLGRCFSLRHWEPSWVHGDDGEGSLYYRITLPMNCCYVQKGDFMYICFCFVLFCFFSDTFFPSLWSNIFIFLYNLVWVPRC